MMPSSPVHLLTAAAPVVQVQPFRAVRPLGRLNHRRGARNTRPPADYDPGAGFNRLRATEEEARIGIRLRKFANKGRWVYPKIALRAFLKYRLPENRAIFFSASLP